MISQRSPQSHFSLWDGCAHSLALHFPTFFRHALVNALLGIHGSSKAGVWRVNTTLEVPHGESSQGSGNGSGEGPSLSEASSRTNQRQQSGSTGVQGANQSQSAMSSLTHGNSSTVTQLKSRTHTRQTSVNTDSQVLAENLVSRLLPNMRTARTASVLAGTPSTHSAGAHRAQKLTHQTAIVKVSRGHQGFPSIIHGVEPLHRGPGCKCSA